MPSLSARRAAPLADPGAAAPPPSPAPPIPLRHDPLPRLLVRACRPRQWVKNGLVALAPASAGALIHPTAIAAVLQALIAFCLISSATYLLNDVRDRERDRHHPRKRMRPIAAGALAPRTALRVAAGLAVAGLVLAAVVRPALAGVALAYLALTTTYSLWWRHVAILDIAVVAAGFGLRAVAGGVAAGVPLSRSFLIVTTACAVFVVAGKRYAELTTAPRGLRATLRRYSPRSLRRVLRGAAALACVAYGRWAFTHAGSGPWLELSLLPFALWLGRYLRLLGAGFGEAPEELALRDPGLLGLAGSWLMLFAGGIYLAA
jgi:decaprenyl-phosphate phosphoribosyltransferase